MTQLRNLAICRYTARNILTLRVTLSVSLAVSLTPPGAAPRGGSSREHDEALLDPRLEVEQQTLLLTQALVLREQPLRLADGLDGLLDQSEVALDTAALTGSRSQGVDILPVSGVSVSYLGNEKLTVSSDFLRWSVPGSNRRPPACKFG